MTAGLELRNIQKLVDPELHLAHIDLHCGPGSFTVLLGRVRAGKTTLLRTIAGLDRPSAGPIFWNGEDVTQRRERDVAMVYQPAPLRACGASGGARAVRQKIVLQRASVQCPVRIAGNATRPLEPFVEDDG
jgi:ABC-type cobalamin/Fe3+-siderophores transport system ATPase subunit